MRTMMHGHIMQSAPGAEAVIDGRRVLYFAGTAYLGLQGHGQVIRAACEAVQAYGIGAATSRTGFGQQPPTLEVEAAAARYFGHEAALYLPSGYMSAGVTLAALAGSFDRVFVDEQSHYAVLDALAGRDETVIRFGHRNTHDLAMKLRESAQGRQALVVSDGVFAATGRVAPVRDYLKLLAGYTGSALLLDDAHGMGVLGDQGRGTFDHFGVPARALNATLTDHPGPRCYQCGTLAKALGGYGGIVTGDEHFVARLRRASHLFGGCSAPPAAMTAASACALNLLISDPTPRLHLRQNAVALRRGLCRIGLEADDEPTPVVALDLGDEAIMRRAQARLLEMGLAIGYLKYAGTAEHGTLRIAVNALHTHEMIERLLDSLRRVI